MAQANIVPPSSIEDQTSDPSRASQEKPDSDEESTHPSDHLGSLTKILPSSDNEYLIRSYIPADEEPIIIFKTDEIQYELFSEPNIIDHLQHRIAMRSFLCTLTHEKDVNEEDTDEAPLSPTDQLLLLGRVRARYTEERPSTESIYDLQYLVGLTFPDHPRSLWLIYDCWMIEDDEYGLFQLRIRQECDRYRKAAATVEGKWDLGWTYCRIGHFDLG